MRKVNELNGAELAYQVAKIEGVDVELRPYGYAIKRDFDPCGPANEFCSKHKHMWTTYDPTVDWGIAGPIIERERITVFERGSEWAASISVSPSTRLFDVRADTPLVAAMRAYVISRVGEYVDEIN